MNEYNKNDLKVGDTIMVEQAWEDEAGGEHDEEAEIVSIAENGELGLKFPYAREEVKTFLENSDGYKANDYTAETKAVNNFKIGEDCIDCNKPMFNECFLHGAYCEACDVDCTTCVAKDLTQ